MALVLTIGVTDQTAFIRHESMTLKFSTLDLALVNPAVVPAIDDAVTLADPTWSGVVTAVKVRTTVDKGTHKTVTITATNTDVAVASAAPIGLSDTPNGTTTFAYAELNTSRQKDRQGATTLTGSLITYTAGIWPAMTFQLTSAAQGFSAQDFTARDVTVTWIKSGSPRYRIDFGDPIVTMSVWMNSSLSGTIDTTKITDGSVTTPKLAAGAVTADKIAALLILASLIKTAASGTRLELDAAGMRAYDASENLLVNIPTDGSAVFVRGQIEATDLLVTGGAVLAGVTNEVAIGGTFQAAAQRQPPSQAPALSQGWDTVDLPRDATKDDASGTYYRSGIDYTASGGAGGATKVFLTVNLVSGGGNRMLELKATDRTVNRSIDLEIPGGTRAYYNAVRHGSWIYVLWTDDFGTVGGVSRYLNSTLAFVDDFFPSMPINPRRPHLCSDGTNLYIVDKATSTGTIKWNKYNDTMVKQGSTIDTTYNSGTNDTVLDAAAGNFDFGAFRMAVLTAAGDVVDLFDSTGARQANEQFPVQSSPDTDRGGITYGDALGDGARFWSHGGSGTSMVLTKHSTWVWTTASSKYWVAYSWNDSVGTTHETTVGPMASTTMGRRKKLTVTTASLPGVGGADDPDGARVYMVPNATTPATTALKLQATGLSPFALSTYNSGGAAPPVSNNFPAGTPAIVQSSQQPGWLFRGDGTYDVKEIARIQSRSTNPQSISNSTWTVLTYETADLADDTNLAIASGVVTVAKAGLYRVSGVCVWAANSTGVRHFGIGVNGSTPAQRRKVLDDATASGSNVTAQAISLLLQLSANDTVALYGQQSSGGALNVTDALLNVERVSS